jgi:tetratricopeptide (TPR) repeat protein
VFEVFVNYRTADTRFGASVAYELLAARFGPDHVFLDHRSMPPGAIYPSDLRAGIEQARVLLVLIGPEWLAADPADPNLRLVDRPQDWVRREIRRAIERDIHVIPVLLDGVPLPPPGTLPPDIDQLTLRQKATVQHRRLAEDIDRLAATIADLVPELDLPDLFVEQLPLPGDPPPSELLNPIHRIVEYHDHLGQLAQLVAWLTDSAPVGVRLFTGPGGSGKTRLAVELIDEAKRLGWRAGVVRDGATPAALRRIAAVAAPLLLIVDYAEARTAQVAELTAQVLSRSAPTRIVLLARSAGRWLRDLQGHADVRLATIYDKVADEHIPPLVVTGRRDWYERAVAGFRAARDLDAAAPTAPPEDLYGDRYDRALDIHAAALASVLDESAAGLPTHADPVRRVLDHEQRYWSSTAVRYGLPTRPEPLGELVAAATLVGADDARTARAVLGALRSHERRLVPGCLAWLGALYPGPAPLNPLRPDRLGEDFVAITLAPENYPELAEDLAPIVNDTQVARALTVLARGASRHPHVHEAMTALLARNPTARIGIAMAVATQVDAPELVDVLARLGYAPELSAAVLENLPDSSLTLAGLATAHAAALLRVETRSANPDLRLVAGLRHELAVRLRDVGEDDRALQEAIMAVATYREVLTGPDSGNEDARDLADALTTLAGAYARAGLAEDARAAAAEGLRLAESLSDPDSAALIAALRAVADTDLDLGEVDSANDAISRVLQLVDLNGTEPALSAAVLEQAAMTAMEGNDPDRAIAFAEDALARYRELDADNPDGFRDDLVRMLGTTAGAYADLGRWEAGLALGEEAVGAARALIGRYGDTHLTRLADALVNTAAVLRKLDRRDDALTYLTEAILLRRALADRLPGEQLADLAGALYNLGNLMNELGKPQEALDAYEQARQLHPKLPIFREEDLASVLIAKARVLVQEGRAEEADELIAEAVRTLGDIADARRINATATLAEALRLAAEVASELGRAPDALRYAERSVRLYREVVRTSRRPAHRRDFAGALHTWARELDEADATEEAWAVFGEAIEQFRLVPEQADELAAVLIGAAGCATNLGDLASAIDLNTEAVRLCRANGDTGPNEIEALNNLADALADNHEWQRAADQAAAALKLVEDRGCAPLLMIAVLLTNARIAADRGASEGARLVRRAWATAGEDAELRTVVRDQAAALRIPLPGAARRPSPGS